MNKSVQEEAVREDADKEGMGPHNRCEGRVCAEEGEGVPIVKGEKVRGKRVC